MRTRNIRPGYFTNDVLAALPALDRILFAGLWCLGDCQGRLEDRPRRIKAEALPYDSNYDYDAGLGRLRDAGFIVRYRVGEGAYIAIPKFHDHQYLSADERKKHSEIPAPPGTGDLEAAPVAPREDHGSTTEVVPKSHGSATEVPREDFDRTTDNGQRTRDNGSGEGVQGDPLPAPAEPAPAPTRCNGVPVAAIVEAWNTVAAPAGAIACRKVADAWKGAIRARWLEAGATDDERMAAFRAQFEAVAASRLCTGRVAHGDRRPWRASLDWLVKAGNWAKVANGNFLDDPTPVRAPPPPPEPPRPEPTWARLAPDELASTLPAALELWRRVLDLLRARVDPRGVATWIEPLEPLGLVDDVLVLAVADEFAARWVCDNYIEVLKDALWDVRQQHVGVGLRIASGQEVAA